MNENDMVLALIREGMTEMEIAKNIGSTQPTIHRIKKGSTTNYKTGKSLELLYLKRTS